MSEKSSAYQDFSSYGSGYSFGGDSTAGVFEPDVMLPSQYFTGGGDGGVIGGERKLMAALLSDGIEAYISQSIATLNGCAKRTDAIEWVETEDHSYVFSFDLVCDSLGLNPAYLRLGLAKYITSLNEKKSSGEVDNVWKKIRRPRKQ